MLLFRGCLFIVRRIIAFFAIYYHTTTLLLLNTSTVLEYVRTYVRTAITTVTEVAYIYLLQTMRIISLALTHCAIFLRPISDFH